MIVSIDRFKALFIFCFFRISRELIGRPLLFLLRVKSKFTNVLPVLPEHLANLQKYGVATIESFISTQHSAEIIKEIDDCIGFQSPELFCGDDIRMFNAQSKILGVLPFYNNFDIRKIGSAFLGTPIKNSDCLINLVQANKSALGSGGSWHRDAIFPQFKALIYLSDVCDEKDGAFTYIPKSNRSTYFIKEMLRYRRSPFNTRWSESEINANPHNQPISIIGKAGTLVLFDTCLLHRGNPNLSANNHVRYAATNYYRSIFGSFVKY